MSLKLRRLLGLVLLACACRQAAGQELEWKSNLLRLQARHGQEAAAGDIRFTNKSDRAVTITGIKTSCKCVRATADKATYPPGTDGVLHVVFVPEGRIGTHTQSVSVATDAKDAIATKLDVVLTIPVPDKAPFPPYRR